VGLIERLKKNLRESVPGGTMVLFSVTAPIRSESKTAADLEATIRALLAERPNQQEHRCMIYGNRVRIRFEKSASPQPSNVIGFVHNPETDPCLLFAMTRSLLELLEARAVTKASKNLTGDRWLVLLNPGEPSYVNAYRYIYSELRIPTAFKKTLVVFPGGVETLN
jgi:hypothetical protein